MASFGRCNIVMVYVHFFMERGGGGAYSYGLIEAREDIKEEESALESKEVTSD
jgi:hypothetical protein